MREAVAQFENLTESLGYRDGSGLVISEQESEHPARRRIFLDARKHIRELHAIYFAGSQPLIYFVVADHLSPQQRADLHRRAWNDGQVPLLICVTRSHVLVYNTTALPTADSDEVDKDHRRLLKSLEVTADFLAHLNEIRRPHLESGATWMGSLGSHFVQKTRCGETLLINLRSTSEILVAKGLPQPMVHRLLLRTILILYLEQRGVLDEHFYQRVRTGNRSLTECLRNRKSAFDLFDSLADKFNGDLFPVERKERSSITDDHLKSLGEFLSGRVDTRTGQLWLWPLYDFSVIPIHMVSAIYELFLHQPTHASAKKSRSPGIGEYYTPPFLAELILEEVLPWPNGQSSKQYDIRVMDPTCGSGIFLVEAFRRLVERWRAAHPDQAPSISVLCDLLRRNIYGIDNNPEAVTVAAFSLYLSLLGYAEPRAILTNLRLPKLTLAENGDIPNLEYASAFQSAALSSGTKFDLVVGNLPWKRNWVPAGASDYLKSRQLPAAKEGAHAFMWLGAEFTPNGKGALVCSSKWLFNQEKPDVEFRRQFFSATQVETIINLSAIRRGTGNSELFSKAIGPASIVVFKGTRPKTPSANILYCTPKPALAGCGPRKRWVQTP